jgi:DNA-binding NarL/FixJ family response regulator
MYGRSGAGAPLGCSILTDRRIRGAAGLARQISAVRTLIVDDCTLHRESLAEIFALIGSAPTVAWDMPSLVAALREATPDVVLMNTITKNNVALLCLIREECPNTKVIVVGISDDDEDAIVSCAEAGVAGYHVRSESLDDLMELIAKVVDGESACSPRVSAVLLKRLSTLASQREPVVKELVLTAREIQILRMLEMGLSNRDIADQLCIALHTVKNHVHSVLGKLGVRTRLEAASFARSSHAKVTCIEDLGP